MKPSNFQVRASSFGTLFDCAHRFEWKHILNKRSPAGMGALLGTAIHAGAEAYDNALMAGQVIEIEEAINTALHALENPEQDYDFNQGKLRMADARVIAAKLITKYCLEIRPTVHFVGVETKLEPLHIDCGNGMELVLTGRLDRARASDDDFFDNSLGVDDIKTGARAISNGVVSVKSHKAQLGTYQIMLEQTVKRPVPRARIIALGTGGRHEVGISHSFDARPAMLGTEETVDAPKSPGLIEYAVEIFRSGLFPPNPQSSLCSEVYCSRWNHCKFHE